MIRTTHIGIDPGRTSGGIAYLTSHDTSPVALAMPKTDTDVLNMIRELAEGEDQAICFHLEEIPLFVGGGKAAASIIKVKGHQSLIEGMIRMAQVMISTSEKQISINMIPPKRWQKGLSIPPKVRSESSPQWKRRLKEVAAKMFPTAKITANTADALLIMEFGRRESRSSPSF